MMTAERIEVGFGPITHPVNEGDIAMLQVVLNMAYSDQITVSLQTNDGTATGNYHCYLKSSIWF